MASLDFDLEKDIFRKFYEEKSRHLTSASELLRSLINSLIQQDGKILISKIDNRVKEKEECIKKFQRKYLTDAETNNTPYTIKDHITDLIGIRIVCLYEDDIENIKKLLSENFNVIEVTDKISHMESKEDSFGYKGLHMDIKFNNSRDQLPEYKIYNDLQFEIQIRTIIQDSWSVLDHKIKYKKSIPTKLKRRINTLAALFELADREFKSIRDETILEIEKTQMPTAEETDKAGEIDLEIKNVESGKTQYIDVASISDRPAPAALDAFSFLIIAKHFFRDFSFDAHNVDVIT